MFGEAIGLSMLGGLRAMTQEEIEAKIKADMLAYANRATDARAAYGQLRNAVRPAPDVIGGPKRVPDVPEEA